MRLRKLLEAIECGTSVGIIKKKAGLPYISYRALFDGKSDDVPYWLADFDVLRIRCGGSRLVVEVYEERKMIDMVNRPAHYNKGRVECIDAIEVATSDLSGIEAVCTANAIKYLWRWKQKNGTEDLKKPDGISSIY